MDIDPILNARPVGASRDSQVKLPTQYHLNQMLLEVCLSSQDKWKEGSSGFFRNTSHGIVLAEGCCNRDDLEKLLRHLGPYGIQVLYTTLDLYVQEQQRRWGTLPEYSDCSLMTIKVTQLLRSMGRNSRPTSGGFSRSEQIGVLQVLLAFHNLNFYNVMPLNKKKDSLRVGYLIDVPETSVAVDMESDYRRSSEPMTVTIIPGREFWDQLRSGRYWFPKTLLRYHPINDKYAIAIGTYLAQLLCIRRNKNEQNTVTLGTVEQRACISKFDSNEYRRMQNIEKALHKLARDGVIGGKVGSDGDVDAVITPPVERRGRQNKADQIRSKTLILMHPQSNGSVEYPLELAS